MGLWPDMYLDAPQRVRMVHRPLAVRVRILTIRLEKAAGDGEHLRPVLHARRTG